MSTKAELEAEIASLRERLAKYDDEEKKMLGKGSDVPFAQLVGLHTLDAVDQDSLSIERYEGSDDKEDCNVLWFRLDGVVYGCVEDPSDGYRSSMREFVTWDRPMVNSFVPCKVLLRHKEKAEYGHAADLLEAIDIETGKQVLEVGTDNSDDYYPIYVASFSPENMVANK